MRRVLRRELADAEVTDTLKVIWMECEVTVLKGVTVDRFLFVDPDPDDCHPPEICLENLDGDEFVSSSNLSCLHNAGSVRSASFDQTVDEMS